MIEMGGVPKFASHAYSVAEIIRKYYLSQSIDSPGPILLQCR